MDQDTLALEYARNYQRAQAQGRLGASPSGGQIMLMPSSSSAGTMKTLIVVAGLVTVAWLWMKYRKG